MQSPRGRLQSAAMWGRLYRLVLADPIAYIDDFQAQPSHGPRSPAFTAWFSAIAVAVLLTLMNFYVLDGSFQSKAAELIAKLVGWLPEGTVRTTQIGRASCRERV